MSNLQQFEYSGQIISFQFKDGNRMINATEMIKLFPDKRMNNFLRNASTKSYIVLLESRYANSRNVEREVLRVIQGGTNPELQGTWMDEKLALKFAAWLSPEFELWVYDRIEELLRTGETKLEGYEPKGVSTVLRLVADKLEEQDRINENVEERLSEIEAKITSSESGYYTILGFCALLKIACPISQAKIYGRQAAALSRELGFKVGTAHDERYGKVGTYHEEVLKQVITE